MYTAPHERVRARDHLSRAASASESLIVTPSGAVEIQGPTWQAARGRFPGGYKVHIQGMPPPAVERMTEGRVRAWLEESVVDTESKTGDWRSEEVIRFRNAIVDVHMGNISPNGTSRNLSFLCVYLRVPCNAMSCAVPCRALENLTLDAIPCQSIPWTSARAFVHSLNAVIV